MMSKSTERKRIYDIGYRVTHLKELRAHAKVYNAANREKQKAYSTAYYVAHREEKLAYGKAYWAIHKKELKANSRVYNATHQEKNRDGWRLYHYGLTKIGFNDLIREQGGVCAICRQKDWSNKGLLVDHNHVTGRVRGLLCGRCNTALGMAGDNPKTLRAMADYLESNVGNRYL